MKTAHIYITAGEDHHEESHRVRILDTLPEIGSDYLNTYAKVFAIEPVSAHYIESDDEAICNGSVYLIRAEHADGKRFEVLVLVPADLTMSVDEFIANLMDNDREGIEHMTVEDAADTLRVMRQNDYKNEIPADLTADELARRWNEIKGTDLWYALLTSPDDDDWGTGTYDRAEALERLQDMRVDYPDAYIAVIRESENPTCIDEIR